MGMNLNSMVRSPSVAGKSLKYPSNYPPFCIVRRFIIVFTDPATGFSRKATESSVPNPDPDVPLFL
jgi:hypothetical protein